jgi:hypothetical protein
VDGKSVTEASLLASAGVSSRVLRNCVSELIALGLVEKVERSVLRLAEDCPPLEWDLWAFELKVDHWQRALFQACQYHAFAQHSVVVLAERWIHRVDQRLDRFKALGVGLFALDVDLRSLRVILPPRTRLPAYRWHHLYALGKILVQGHQRANMR